MSWIKPITLQGNRLRLEPLSHDHASGLFEAATPETFRFMWWTHISWDPEGFKGYVDWRWETCPLPMAVIDQQSDKVLGSSSFMAPNEQNRNLEIGHTWYTPSSRGTGVNPECKLLMLQHAFENLNCIRVVLKCDERNIISQKAIEKLGAQREGIWRSASLLADGHRRNTVYFSILEEEWPTVKQRLLQRLWV